MKKVLGIAVCLFFVASFTSSASAKDSGTKAVYNLTVSKAGAGASSSSSISSLGGINCGLICSAAYDDTGGENNVSINSSPNRSTKNIDKNFTLRLINDSVDPASTEEVIYMVSTREGIISPAGGEICRMALSVSQVSCNYSIPAYLADSVQITTSIFLLIVLNPGIPPGWEQRPWQADETTNSPCKKSATSFHCEANLNSIPGETPIIASRVRKVGSLDRQVSVYPSGSGSVSTSPGSEIGCGSNCSKTYNPGDVVKLIATPDPGSRFKSWAWTSGSECAGGANNPICSFTVPNERGSLIYANFEPIPYNLSVKLTGNGKGLVASNPVGINCGTICQFSWNEVRSVTLTATAAKGYAFKGWWNATVCKSSPNKTCVVNVPQEGIEIRAKFIKLPKAKITYGPKERTTKTKAYFKFRGTKKAAFKCSIDSSPWEKCRSPERFYNLGLGGHVFMVKPYIGEVAGKRAAYKWKVVAKKRKR